MHRARAARLMVTPIGFHYAALAVEVSRPDPVGKCVIRPILATALRRCFEIPVYPEELLAAAAESRVGKKDLTGAILEEDTVAGKVLQVRRPCRCFLVIVESAPGRNLLRCKGDVEIVIEIRAV